MHIRVYNYNTSEKVKAFEAHSDYIRSLAVHPTLPYVLSSSDDMLIKLWDWDKNWTNVQVFEGHSHYVMMLAINPKDTNTFASASLDRTIKVRSFYFPLLLPQLSFSFAFKQVWGFGSNTPYFTLEGHEKGVNCIEYYPGGEKPYLVSGADDK
jgi:coatomer subunit beta'